MAEEHAQLGMPSGKTGESTEASAARIAALEQEVADLQRAVASRQRIGVAVGLLAQRFHCTPEQAWQVLLRLSENTNTKLRRVAQLIIDLQSGKVSEGDAALAEVLHGQLPSYGFLTSFTELVQRPEPGVILGRPGEEIVTDVLQPRVGAPTRAEVVGCADA